MAVAMRKDEYAYANVLPAEEPQGETIVMPAAAARSAAMPRTMPRPANKPRVSPFSVLGYIFIGMLAVACMLSQVELTSVSAEITGVYAHGSKVEARSGYAQRLNELREENKALRIAYEQTFDLNAIELYATRELGMVSNRNTASSRSAMVETPDKAVVPMVQQGSFFTSMRDYFVSLAEYFK